MHQPRITLIAAISENRGLGKDNQLLWKIAQDLQFFKQTTTGNPIIMGRKTYESIGRPLPKRLNIVVSRSAHVWPGCMLAHSLEQAIAIAQTHLHARAAESPNAVSVHDSVEPEIFIIGGAQIYQQALAQQCVNRVWLTHIHAVAEADAFFPESDSQHWRELSRECHFDEPNAVDFDFVCYEYIGLPSRVSANEPH